MIHGLRYPETYSNQYKISINNNRSNSWWEIGSLYGPVPIGYTPQYTHLINALHAEKILVTATRFFWPQQNTADKLSPIQFKNCAKTQTTQFYCLTWLCRKNGFEIDSRDTSKCIYHTFVMSTKSYGYFTKRLWQWGSKFDEHVAGQQRYFSGHCCPWQYSSL